MPSIASVAAPSGVRLEISPATAFIDDELSIRILGLKARETVTIRASTEDDDKRVWSSHAMFSANSSGIVDVASQEPLSGTYRGVSPMGLFWSMNLEEPQEAGRTTFAKKSVTANKVTLEVRSAERVIAATHFERGYLANGTQTRDLQVPGEPETNGMHTVGRLFLPPGAKAGDRLPVVVVLSGSGGGFDLDKAAVIARHGFAAFALAYFGTPPLPTWLHHIPLEYFEAAFGWLSAQPEVDAQRLGMFAVSRGAELALLLGSRFPQIRAVVAYAPSSVVWAAGGRDKQNGELPPSWTHGGEAIPFVPLPLRQFIFRSAIPVALLKRPVMFRDLFRAGLRNSKAVAAAAIAVERLHGPLMVISSGDDHLWPAEEMSEAIVAHLKQHDFAHRVEHLHYPDAGHMLRYPYLPTTARASRNPHLRNARYSFGGTAAADAEAQADSWRRAIAFLKSAPPRATAQHFGAPAGIPAHMLEWRSVLKVLQNLLELQSVDVRLNDVRARLAAFPKKISDLDARIAAAKAELEQSKAAQLATIKDRKKYELDVEQHKERVRKYRDQSAQIKTNEAYKALQHEVQMAEEEIAKAEDRLLEQMVASEEYDRRIKAAELRLKEVEGSVRTQRAAIESEKAAADKDLALVEADRKRVTSEIPEDMLDHYERIAKRHGGVALAEVDNEKCSLCGMQIRPHVFQKMRNANNEDLFHCETCTRILYYIEPTAVPPLDDHKPQTSDASASASTTGEN